MESNGQDYAESTGTGVMVSNLPLLFTRGFPSSLHYMKLDELEDFVPFMVRCSLGEENPVSWSQLPRPTWWPRKLPFRVPSGSTPVAKRSALVSLVESCYSFHGCEYLLQFCASLLESMPTNGFRFNDNRDGTTSMYHGTTGKLLVTFRNENRDYDKSNHDLHLRKKLLLSPTRVSTSGTTTAVFQPAATDIYLCDKCENEFYSLREVQIHEKKCRGDAPPSPVPPSPDPEPVEEEPEPAGQVPFLAYFKLQPAKHTGIEPYMSPKKRSSSPPRKSIGPMFPRFDSVALTSPLGKFLLANSKLRNKYQASQHLVIRYERHLHATPHTDVLSSRERCTNRWIVVWRPNKEEQPWGHLYCFTKAHRRERRLTIQSGLDWRSRRLLSLCRPARVSVKRLQKRVVDRVMRLNGPNAPCIDLTDEPQRMLADFMCPENFMPASAAASVGITLNGTQKMDDPLRLFYDSNEGTLNLGASSSYSPGVPSLLGSIPVGVTPIQNSWNNEMQMAESASLALGFHPGDIIQHDSISLLPLPSPSVIPKHSAVSMNSNVNHVARHSSSQYRGAAMVGAPGPKCSKIARQAQLVNKQSVQQNSTGYTISNSELIQLSQGDFGVLNRLSNSVSETSPAEAEGSSGLSASRSSFERKSIQNQGRFSQSVPLLCRNNSTVLLQNTSNVDISNVPLPGENSAIEVIDLSSDEDEAGRVRRYSEADRAPSRQLDGLACYQHSGAKVPGSSSKLSMPKNGNSHWSSNCKSHCDAGRVGDLATNGQPPNVLKTLIFPVPSSLFLPPPSPALPCAATSANKMNNPRKRRCEDSPLGGNASRKLKVLEVSSQGLKVLSQEENVAEGNDVLSSANYSHKDENTSTPFELIPLITREFGGVHYVPAAAATVPGSNQSGAFVNNSVHQDSRNARPKSRQSEDQAVSQSKSKDEGRGHVSDISSLILAGSSSRVLENSSSKTSSQEKSSIGLLSNIVNTVSKGMEYICSLVGTASTSDNKLISQDKLPSRIRKVSESGSVIRDNEKGKDLSTGKSTQVPPRGAEVQRLLQDECRELHRNGLGDIRFVDLQNTKLTRRSIERALPSKAQRKPRLVRSREKESGDSHYAGTGSGVYQGNTKDSTSPKSSDNLLSACIDENGNSPTFVKTKLGKGAQYDNCGDNIAKQSDYYLSQMENSNNNNNNRNTNNNGSCVNVEHPISSRNGKMFADPYRDRVDIVCGNQTQLRDGSDPVNIVNSGHNSVRVINVIESVRDVNDKDVLMGKCSVLESKSRSKCNGNQGSKNAITSLDSEKYSGSENDRIHSSGEFRVSAGNANCGLTLLEGPTMGLSRTGSQRTKSRRILPVKKGKGRWLRLSPSSSPEVAVNYRNLDEVLHSYHNIVCTTAVTGKTAEEGGALQAKVPSSYRLHHLKPMSTPASAKLPSCSLQNSNISCQRSDIWTNSGETICKSSGYSAFSEVPLQKNDIPRVNHLSKNLVSEEEEEREVEKGFQPTSSVTSGQQFEHHGNSLLIPVVGNTKDSRMRAFSKTHTYSRKDVAIPSELLTKRKRKKGFAISMRELASLGEDEWKEMTLDGFHPSNNLGVITVQSHGSASLGDNDDDIENMPMHDRLHGKAKEKRSRDRTTDDKRNHCETISLQSSSSSCGKFLVGDSTYLSDRVSIRESSCSNSRNFDDTDRYSAMDGMPWEGGSRLSLGKHDNRRRSLLRELSNLGKDNWKELQKKGFHPSDLVESSVVKRTCTSDESDNEVESDSTDSEPLNKRLRDQKANPKMLQHRKQLADDAKGDNCSTKPKKKSRLSRELKNLGKDEWKEAHGTGFHPSSLIPLGSCQELVHEDDGTENKDQDLHWSGKKKGRPKLFNSSSKVEDGSNDGGECAKKRRKKSSVPRELLNLGKDEWKEMRNTGFHPADFVGSENNDEVAYFFGESEDDDEEDSDSVENEPPPKVLQGLQLNELKGIGRKLPRELACLLKDECKELKQRKGSDSNASSKFRRSMDNRERHSKKEERHSNSLLLSNQYTNSVLNSVNMLNEFKSLKDSNRCVSVRSTRSQTNVVSLVEVMTPRDSHRQLLRTETAMCVFNFKLPLIS